LTILNDISPEESFEILFSEHLDRYTSRTAAAVQQEEEEEEESSNVTLKSFSDHEEADEIELTASKIRIAIRQPLNKFQSSDDAAGFKKTKKITRNNSSTSATVGSNGNK